VVFPLLGSARTIGEHKPQANQPWSRYLNVMDRQRDRQTTYCGITALCVASRGKNQTRSSAVDVIADRTAYDESYVYWQSIKLVSVTSWRAAGSLAHTQSDLMGEFIMNAPKLNPIKRDWPMFTKWVNNSSNVTRPVHVWLSVSKTSRSRFLRLNFFTALFG